MIGLLISSYGVLIEVRKVKLNSDLGGLFSGSFWGGGGGKITRLKLVTIMLETSNLSAFFCKNPAFFGKNSTYTQNNSVRAVLETF